MNNIAKLILIAAALTAGAASWAAPTTWGADAVTTTPGTTTDSNTTNFTVSQTQCPALKEGITVAASVNVGAAFDCSNGINAGIATSNWKGRGRTYRVHSAGGSSPQEKPITRSVDISAARTAAGADATNAMNEAGT